MSKASDIFKQMEKLYGDDGLGKIGPVEVLSTGSYVLDEAIGPWGAPKGRLCQFAGREASGKTFMSLMMIKELQQRNPNNWAYFIDAEYALDIEWCKKLGVDVSPERFRVLRSNKGVEIFEKLCGVPHKEPGKPKVKLGLLDLIKQVKEEDGENSGDVIIVLDSIASVMPPMEEASPSGKNNMALMSRFLPPELRKTIPLLSQTGTTLIAINQVRTDPGKLWGNPETTPGGQTWKHFCSLMINFTYLENKDSKIFDKNGDQIGHTIRARMDKVKVGAPFRVCDFTIEYTKGITNKHQEIADLATKYGVVNRPNNKTYEYKGHKFVGKDNYYNAFLDGTLDQEEILKQVKEAKEARQDAILEAKEADNVA